ncbi:cobalamin B12-binding domain-containing protein [Candidatus Woesearchaeota archaeon]|nr:cobalamin B12-binding domain-containing protein [Candidatus Woesearchaeota archaeon]
MTDVLCVVTPFSYGRLDSVGPKCPNLGLGFIAAVIEEMGYDVKILDCFGLELTKEETFKEMERHNPNVVLVGAVTANFTISMDVLKKSKELNPAVVTVIGGPHVTVNPESAFEERGVVDFVVIGEAEETIAELLCYIKKKSDVPLHRIKGIIYVDESGKMVRTEKRGVVKFLDKLPMPAYHLFPMDRYHSYGWLNLGRKFSTMITSRGCPFKCRFCQSSQQAQFWRQRSAENVFKEIQLLYDVYGIRHIYFQDDEFCVNHQRIIDICDKIKEAKMDLAWECLTRVNHVDEALLSSMASAGCKSVLFGVETGYEEGFKKINKPISCDMVVRAVRIAEKCGIMTRTAFILGFPWEGEEEMRKTIKFAKKVNADLTFFNVLTPYPETPLHEEMVAKNLFEQPDNYDMHIIHGTDPLIRTEKLTSKQLRYWCGRAVLEFYLRPSYIWKKVKKVKSWGEFKSNFFSGNDLLKLAFKKVLAGRGE